MAPPWPIRSRASRPSRSFAPPAGASPLIDELLRSIPGGRRDRSTGCPRSSARRRGSGIATACPPGKRSSAAMPSAVGATSTPAPRWKRIAKVVRRALAPPPGGQQHVLAAQFAAVGGEHQLAAVEEAEAAGIAVMARLDPAARRRFPAAPARPRRRRGRACRRHGSRSNCCRRRTSVECAAVVRRPSASAGGICAIAARAPPQLTTSRCGAVGHLERQRRGAAARDQPRDRRRRGVDDHAPRCPARAADSPSRAPGAAGGRARRWRRRSASIRSAADRAAALPARQAAVAVTDAEQRRHHPRRAPPISAGGRRQPARVIDRAQHRQQHDRCRAASAGERATTPPSSYTACVERARQPGLADLAARIAAGDQQPGGDHAAPGGDARQPGGRLVGAAIEMPRAARQRVEHLAAIDQVGRRQDQRRVRGPEQDAAAPQIGAPGRLADLVGMRGEPARASAPRRSARRRARVATVDRSRSQAKLWR